MCVCVYECVCVQRGGRGRREESLCAALRSGSLSRSFPSRRQSVGLGARNTDADPEREQDGDITASEHMSQKRCKKESKKNSWPTVKRRERRLLTLVTRGEEEEKHLTWTSDTLGRVLLLLLLYILCAPLSCHLPYPHLAASCITGARK